MGGLIHWLLFHAGILKAGPDHWYNFWSGIGSDVGEATLITGVIMAVRHINCHATRCRAIRTHPVPNTPYRACRKHHPTVPTSGKITADDISDAHAASNRSNA